MYGKGFKMEKNSSRDIVTVVFQGVTLLGIGLACAGAALLGKGSDCEK